MPAPIPLTPPELAYLLASFPKLGRFWDHTSDPDVGYNCFAWAAGERHRRWDWSTPYYWPLGVQRSSDIDVCVQAFGTLGYTRCTTGDAPEPGIEKVALYAIGGTATHAALQLESGLWTSKLGYFIDVSHELDGLISPTYGLVAHILCRPR